MDIKIGVIWSSKIENKAKYSNNIIIYDNIKMSNANLVLNKIKREKVDAIVVTAGISHELDKDISLPVIVGYPNYIDILETLNFIENQLNITNKKIAIILQESNPFFIERILPFSMNTLKLFFFCGSDELEGIINLLHDEKYYGFISGPTAAAVGSKFGMHTFPLAFGSNIIKEAINKAKNIIATTNKEHLLVRQLETIINISQDGVIIADRFGAIQMCNPKAVDLLNINKEKIQKMNIQQIIGTLKLNEIENDNTDILVEYNNNNFFIFKQSVKLNNEILMYVIRMQEVSKIQNLERKSRSIQKLGLVAKYRFNDIIYTCNKMKETIEEAKASAKFDFTVLIYGESGTGKEMFAQSIHNHSNRKSGPFVAINCAAITETLLESELMGYEEGAFTGAKKGGKIGLFERAHNGTIFLDEISLMSTTLQAKVLRVIQERAVTHIGGNRVIPFDTRIIAATNTNLEENIKLKTFRSDLYYRLNVINIELPPLRKRYDDLPALVEYFLKNLKNKYSDILCDSKEILNSINNYPWPGNIRELENYVIRYCIMHKKINNIYNNTAIINYKEKEEAPKNTLNDSIIINVDSLENMNKRLISEIVKRCDGNKTNASTILKISRDTIRKKLNS